MWNDEFRNAWPRRPDFEPQISVMKTSVVDELNTKFAKTHIC